ncbi:LOW QUALITY PROTEIN: hypothetical protein V2J09_003851 [Rumex salicifolius]
MDQDSLMIISQVPETPMEAEPMTAEKDNAEQTTEKCPSPKQSWRDKVVIGGVDDIGQQAPGRPYPCLFPRWRGWRPEDCSGGHGCTGVGMEVVGVKILDKPVSFLVMEQKLRQIWTLNAKIQILDLSNGCFLVRFCTENGYLIVLTNDPWALLGRYLIVPAGRRNSGRRSQSSQHREFLLQITADMGKPVRVDPRNLYTNRGMFAHVCVEVDLERPPKGTILINDNHFLVEYKGLSIICFGCGRYGHLQNGCPYRTE